MACWHWGAYLGPEALTKGVDIGVSSWSRIAPNTLPAMSKAAANYMNSQLIRMEATFNGYAEGIALDTGGHVSEGSGMNVFLVHDGTLYTPPLATSILPGITRNTVVTIAEDLDIPVKEQVIPREMLYIVDEVFFVRHGRRNHAHPLASTKSKSAKASPGRSPASSRKNSSPSPAAPNLIATTG